LATRRGRKPECEGKYHNNNNLLTND